jgi:hypothetical protein
VLAAGRVHPARAEEHTIQAAAPRAARARVFVTGPRQAFLLGVLAGRLAVEGQPTPLDRAEFVCPAVVDGDYAANT